jgi:gas vesicle protein
MDEDNSLSETPILREPKTPGRKRRKVCRFKRTLIYAAYRSTIECDGSAIGDYLERNWKVVKRIAMTSPGVFILLAFGFGWAGYAIERQNGQQQIAVLSGSNSFLQGKIQGQEETISQLKEQIKDNQNQIQNLKTDFNETKREKDTRILSLTTERDSLTAERNSLKIQLAQWETLPNNVLEMYNSIQKLAAPDSRKELDLLFDQFKTATTAIQATTQRLEQSLQLKPFRTRLIECLNSISPEIMNAIKEGKTRFTLTDVSLPAYQELNKLSKEPDADKFFSMTATNKGAAMAFGTMIGGSFDIELKINSDWYDDETTQPLPVPDKAVSPH